MKRALKLILILLNTFLSISALALVKLIFCHAPRRKLRYAYQVNYLFNKIFVFILGIKICLSGEKEILGSKGVFFVSNHLSYIDGIAISSLVPLVFIGRSDLRSWPIFGILSSLSYTIFVDRVSPSNIHNEIERILFPEGTSTDGSKLLPFKSSFFTVAVHTECPVVPLAVKYKKINGQNINERNKDLVYWYGEMDFIPHLFRVLGLNKIELEIKICEPIDVLRLEGKAPSLQRKYLSDASRVAIQQHLS
jgi:1-acyl-sn-glycerol-3-phosphate acyltransferase